MTGTEILSKLKGLYQQLDSLEKSGEDVVADIRKEINNLELEYLKDKALPSVMGNLAKEVSQLRCQIDLSVRFDEDGAIDYSFCTSGSSQFFRDKIEKVSQSYVAEPQEVFTPLQRQEKAVYKSGLNEDGSGEEIQSHANPLLHRRGFVATIEYDSAKGFAISGDITGFESQFRKIGGSLTRLKNGNFGWIFSRKREPEIRRLLGGYEIKIIDDSSLFDESTEITSNLDTVSEQFRSLQTATIGGHKTPHKAIFLLAVLKGIEERCISSEKIFLNNYLISTFNTLWDRYVPKSWPVRRNVCQPFIHLNKEPFYHLDLKRTIPYMDANWNVSMVNEYCNYGMVTSDLLSLAKEPEKRDALRRILIDTYLSTPDDSIADYRSNLSAQMNSAIATVNRQDERPTQKAIILRVPDDFKTYLRTVKSAQNKPFSTSSIGVYLGAARSPYMQAKASKYISSGSIFDTQDKSILQRIYADIQQDIQQKKASNYTLYALKLYIQFLDSQKNENQIASSQQPVQRRVPTVNVHKSSDSMTWSISVKDEDYVITGKNLTELIVDFVNQLGPELVYDMYIPYLGAFLVDKEINRKYYNQSKQLRGGYWINTCSSTPSKINQIKEIANRLDLTITINHP